MALKCVFCPHFWITSDLRCMLLHFSFRLLAQQKSGHLLFSPGSLFCSIGDLNWPRKQVGQALRRAAGKQSDHAAVRRVGRPCEQQWWAVNFFSTNCTFLEGITRPRCSSSSGIHRWVTTVRPSPKLNPIHMGHEKAGGWVAALLAWASWFGLNMFWVPLNFFLQRDRNQGNSKYYWTVAPKWDCSQLIGQVCDFISCLPAEIVNGVDM